MKTFASISSRHFLTNIMKLVILLALAGCCLAAPSREAKTHDIGVVDDHHHPDDHHVDDSPVHHDAADVEHLAEVEHQGESHHEDGHVDSHHETGHGIPPVIVKQKRRSDGVPSYPEFGRKVSHDEKDHREIRPRGRAFDGHNHEFNYFQGHRAKAVPTTYQQKPVYNQGHDQFSYQESNYQSGNKVFFPQQHRTDDVPQPVAQAPAGDAPPPKPIAILAMNQDVNYDGTFVYDFESENGIKSAVSGSTKHIEGEEKPVQVMSGVYSYISPEGVPVETRWYADETGFHAEGSHLPVAPPVPEAIQRAVDYLKTLPPREDEVEAQPLPVNPDLQVSPQRFEQTFSSQQNYDKPVYQQQNFDRPSFRQQPHDSHQYHH